METPLPESVTAPPLKSSRQKKKTEKGIEEEKAHHERLQAKVKRSAARIAKKIPASAPASPVPVTPATPDASTSSSADLLKKDKQQPFDEGTNNSSPRSSSSASSSVSSPSASVSEAVASLPTEKAKGNKPSTVVKDKKDKKDKAKKIDKKDSSRKKDKLKKHKSTSSPDSSTSSSTTTSTTTPASSGSDSDSDSDSSSTLKKKKQKDKKKKKKSKHEKKRFLKKRCVKPFAEENFKSLAHFLLAVTQRADSGKGLGRIFSKDTAVFEHAFRSRLSPDVPENWSTVACYCKLLIEWWNLLARKSGHDQVKDQDLLSAWKGYSMQAMAKQQEFWNKALEQARSTRTCTNCGRRGHLVETCNTASKSGGAAVATATSTPASPAVPKGGNTKKVTVSATSNGSST